MLLTKGTYNDSNIDTLMVVAVMQGANQHIRSFRGSESCPRTLQHTDQWNQTSNLLITRQWLYP